MNLHGIVRGAINSVNPDRVVTYIASTGATTNTDFSQSPGYAPPIQVRAQIQPLGRDELRQIEKLNLTGVFRTVYLFGDAQGIVRVLAQGGDLLQFAPFQGLAVQNWKIIAVDGPWNVEQGGWTKVICVLQTDTPT